MTAIAPFQMCPAGTHIIEYLFTCGTQPYFGEVLLTILLQRLLKMRCIAKCSIRNSITDKITDSSEDTFVQQRLHLQYQRVALA